MSRGYWGIAFFEPKTTENIGTAIRSANCFGVNFINIIGATDALPKYLKKLVS